MGSWYKSYAQDDITQDDSMRRVETYNQNQMMKLAESGNIEAMQDYVKGPDLWERTKNVAKGAGMGLLDVVARPGYAVGGALEEALEGRGTLEQAKRAGTELFSGVGGLEGQKEFVSDIARQKSGGYAQFSREHPIASMGTDFAMDVVTDPLSLIPASVFGKGAKGIGKGIKYATTPLRKTKGYKAVKDVMGKTFSPSYRWRSGAEKMAEQLGISVDEATKLGRKGYDVVQEELQFKKYLDKKTLRNLEPSIDKINSWTIDEQKNFVLHMYDDTVTAMSDEIAETAGDIRKILGKQGRSESAYLNKFRNMAQNPNTGDWVDITDFSQKN